MDLWLFWAAAVALTLGVAATLWRAMARAGGVAGAGGAFDIAVYRDQLAEIERDTARGTLSAEEGARLRVEVSRRILDTDKASKPGTAIPAGPEGLSRGLAFGLVGLALAGSVVLYARLGAPGYPDLPLKERLALSEEMRQNRLSQTDAEAEVAAQIAAGAITQPGPATADPAFLELMDRLREAVKERPDDARGLELLARNEAALGNLVAARDAQWQLIALRGEAASAEDFAALAELMVMAAGGHVSPETEAELVRALQRDPRNGTARYYTGLMFAQIGRFDRAFVIWRGLLEESPPEAPWVGPLRAQLPEIAARAGVGYTLPELRAPRGPSAEDIEAASELGAEDRQAMVEGMVAQLGERLAAEGGSAEEWARLISSLGVLGRQDEARAIYAEAQERFRGQTVELQGLREAAVQAGVAE